MTASRTRRPERPARGTRPANRRELIIAAATELYLRDGYAAVAMKDVADAVAIGPSALYRHFSGKQDLLYAVVAEALRTVEAVLDELLADPAADPADALAATMLAHRGVGVIWRSESRHLGRDARTELRRQLRGIVARLTEIQRLRRPELDPAQAEYLAWCLLAVTTSVSYHHLELPADRFLRLIADLSRAATAVALPPLSPAARHEPAPAWSPNRREAILRAATRLFARDGFTSVGIEDIGAAVGIAGPSVYNHFSSKSDILTAAMLRGNDLLRADMIRRLDRARDAADAADSLITSYCAFAMDYPDLIRLLVSEIDQLPPDDRHDSRVAQHAYIDEWSQLLRELHPAWDPTETRIRVHAALTVVNDTAATAHLRALENIGTAAVAVCRALLRTR
ncbi:TetR/AcrR family transcriptional regulator [Nocardia sp. 2]|uniref:TetR/AcrR family transcriptional regulator n=1 Tax=Nocardia acididurans TaxID=2802282 RepID=A0ABS1M8D8_9NOCA|nr:TetR/AcrR family transcriptional regulator [Nocardia acididurans]MBL1076829.1 TetR/AcrR family transcriptional regulator [Nocardia acididurans]